jgi:hypothetical protein
MLAPKSLRKRRSSMATVPTTRDVRFWMSRAPQKKNRLEIVIVIIVVNLILFVSHYIVFVVV